MVPARVCPVRFRPMETSQARLFVSSIPHYDTSDADELIHLVPMGDWITMVLYWNEAGLLTVAVDGQGVKAFTAPMAIKAIAFTGSLAACEWDQVQFGTIGGTSTASAGH